MIRINNYKIVQFSDGKFGIRRGWFFYTFYDFISETPSWWGSNQRLWYNKNCRTSYENAKTCFDKLIKYGQQTDYEIVSTSRKDL